MTLKTLNEQVDDGSTTIETLIKGGYIPIDPAMMENLGYDDEEQSFAYHFTNTHHLKGLKTFNKAHQISCFTNVKNDPSLLGLNDIPSIKATTSSSAKIIVKVEGHKLIDGNSDIYTTRDPNGQRWIQLVKHDDSKINDLNTSMEYKKRYNETNKSVEELQNRVKNVTSKTKEQLKDNKSLDPYATYLENMTEMLDDNNGFKLLNKYLDDAIRTDYNEIIMDQIKIDTVYDYMTEDNKELVEKLGLKYGGVVTLRSLPNL